MIRIEWSRKATKQIFALGSTQFAAIRKAVETLLNWPDCRNVKPIVGRSGYRLRVGRYRVLFSILEDGQIRIVHIEEVKKRDEHTY